MANPTMLDVARTLDPKGNTADIIEILNQENPILDDITMVECNKEDSHVTTVRTGLPSSTWRKLNYGVQPSKGTTKQIEDACGMLENYAEIDKALADRNGNKASFRLTEDAGVLEEMAQNMARTMFYGDTSIEPTKFMGLAPRFNQISGVENGKNIINAGGTGNANTSIWLIVWGPRTIHGIYPKGSKVGINQKDLGELRLEDEEKGKYQGYSTHYKWDIGLTLRNWQFVSRIANIKVADLADLANCKKLVNWMVQAEEIVKNLSAGTPVFYCNRTVRTALRQGITEKIASNLTSDTVAGKIVVRFDEIPVKVCDQLVNTEATIV